MDGDRTSRGRWTKPTSTGGTDDKVEQGEGGTTKSIVETEYVVCACSPVGKVWRVSQPRAPGGTVYWTTYTYDELGRVLTVALPAGDGTTTRELSGTRPP
ncbi:MAG: hypothetical protein IPM24_28405 [Bryobacterales bacterium]|nr:hypothetical protein [Bryobacterales bacterium]